MNGGVFTLENFFMQVLKRMVGAEATTQWGLAAQPEDLNSVPGTHMVEGRTHS